MSCLPSRATSPAPLFELAEIVAFKHAIQDRHIRSGQVGKIVQVFGEPPTYYAVACYEANSYGIVSASDLTYPQDWDTQRDALLHRAAQRSDRLAQVGFALRPANASAEEHQRVLRTISVLSDKLERHTQRVPSKEVAVTEAFRSQFGSVYDARARITGPNGKRVDILAGLFIPQATVGSVPGAAKSCMVMIPCAVHPPKA